MTQYPKIDGLDLRKTEAPERGLSVQEYMDILKKERIVYIPCPHGQGWYSVELRPGNVYWCARINWISREPDGPWGHKAGPAYLRNRYGREILWYPKGLGALRASQVMEKFSSRDEFYLYTAKMLIGIILAGRRLYMMHCGQNINSLNSDENPYDY